MKCFDDKHHAAGAPCFVRQDNKAKWTSLNHLLESLTTVNYRDYAGIYIGFRSQLSDVTPICVHKLLNLSIISSHLQVATHYRHGMKANGTTLLNPSFDYFHHLRTICLGLPKNVHVPIFLEYFYNDSMHMTKAAAHLQIEAYIAQLEQLRNTVNFCFVVIGPMANVVSSEKAYFQQKARVYYVNYMLALFCRKANIIFLPQIGLVTSLHLAPKRFWSMHPTFKKAPLINMNGTPTFELLVRKGYWFDAIIDFVRHANRSTCYYKQYRKNLFGFGSKIENHYNFGILPLDFPQL